MNHARPRTPWHYFRKDSIRKHKLALQHVLAWTAYYVLVLVLNYVANPDIRAVEVFAYLLPLVAAFYLNLYIYRLLDGNTNLTTISISIFLVVGLFVTGYYYTYVALPLVGVKLYSSVAVKDYFVKAFNGYLQHFVYSLLYYVGRKSVAKEKRLRTMQEAEFNRERELMHIEREKHRLEQAFFRAQINPHFLHNSLNALFSQALPYSEPLAENILKLSNLMRYALKGLETSDDQVPIQEEVEHMRLLIDIYQGRFAGSLQVETNIHGKPDGHRVPPLTFITIVENALKYGDLKDPHQPLRVSIQMEESQVTFSCSNKKRPSDSRVMSSHKIGLSNLEKRLSYSFGNNYLSNISDSTDRYSYSLTIIHSNDQMCNN